MLCPSCRANHSVEIKGLTYCLNCGSQIRQSAAPPAPAAQPKNIPAKVSVKPAPAPKPKDLVRLREIVAVAKQSAGSTLNLKALWFSFFADVVFAAVVLFPVMILSALPLNLDLFSGEPPLMLTGAIWLVLASAAVIVRVWSSNSTTYGIARQFDHRPAPIKQWRATGYRSLDGILLLRGLQLLGLLVLAVAELGALEVVSRLALPGTEWLFIIPISGLLLYGAIEVMVASALARSKIIADDAKLLEAIRYSLETFRSRQNSLLAGLLLNLTGTLLPLLFITALLYGASLLLHHQWWQLTSLISIPLIAGLLALLGLIIHVVMLYSQSLWVQVIRRFSRVE